MRYVTEIIKGIVRFGASLWWTR